MTSSLLPQHRLPLRRASLLGALCFISVLSLLVLGPVGHASATSPAVASTSVPLRTYVYTAATARDTYGIYMADGVNKDRLVARVKVDSIFFGDVSARLSADSTTVAFRVSGDRLGGSSLYVVNVLKGTYTLVSASKSSAEGIGSYAWSPAGNTMAFVRTSPATDPNAADDAYGSIYIYSVGFQAARLKSSHGSDRLLGFSGDGLGVYVSRQETSGSLTLENLVYLPLSGGAGEVLLRSKSDLAYSNFTIWAQPGATDKVAFLAEGNFALASAESSTGFVSTPEYVPSSTPTPKSSAPTSRVSIAGKLSRPSGLGIGLAYLDYSGAPPALLRRDAENYPVLAWSLDGNSIMAGGTRSGNAWVVGMNGDRKPLGASLADLAPMAWSYDGSRVVLGDSPTTHLVSLDYRTGSLAGTRYVSAAVQPGGALVKLPVPYIQQVNDIDPTADGNWACGPVSIAMALGYYGKIAPWGSYMAQERLLTPVPAGTAVAQPTAPPAPTKPPTGVDYAPYVTNSYTSNGHTYAAMAADPRGRMLSGLYGTICPTGYASWPAMVEVLQWHGLNAQYIAATWDSVVASIKRGHPVLMGTELTAAGHLVLAIGYTGDGNIVVNDPYGNRFAPGYGYNNGQGVVYPWKRFTARRALEIIGVWPPPSPTPASTPTRTVTPTYTATAIPTHTPTSMPTDTAAPTYTPVPTDTATQVATEPPTEVPAVAPAATEATP